MMPIPLKSLALGAEALERLAAAPASETSSERAAAGASTRRAAAQRAATTPRAAAGLQALGRLKAGQMNKTEAAYSRHLLHQQAVGRIAWYRFEGITLKLGDRVRYTPDFVVMRSDGVIELHEVKGSRRIFQDDARAKTRIAASDFPFAVFVVYPRDREMLTWDVESF